MHNSKTNGTAHSHRTSTSIALATLAAALGVSAVICVALDARTASAAGGGNATPSGRLALDYGAKQPTGWEPPYTPTLGGHVSAKDFTYRGKKYRIASLAFGQQGSSPDPVYEDVPANATIRYRQTLAKTWGKYYSFKYQPGGLPGGGSFTAESYSVTSGRTTSQTFKDRGHRASQTFGGDVYVVYHPGDGRGHLALSSDLQFIQVVYEWRGAQPTRVVDNDVRANPFYGEGSGLTSVNGNRSVSFYDLPQWGTSGAALAPAVFMAEVFLAQDTGIKNAAGKDIVNIFGGINWGWEMHSVPQKATG
jgi:hypothetical protein